jgi:hypothetical protein
MGKLAKKGRAADNAVDSNDLKADFIELSEDMEDNEVKRRVFKTNEVSNTATKSTGDCIRWETSANQGLSDSGIISTPSA